MSDVTNQGPGATAGGTRPPYMLGFTSQHAEHDRVELEVRGKLPEWLQGSLLRIGPARFEVGDMQFRHWFDGLGMIHKFTFGGGRVLYTNRRTHGETSTAVEETGHVATRTFATDPCSEMFWKGTSQFRATGNPSVHVFKAGDALMAMGEAPVPVAIDPDSLASMEAWKTWAHDDIAADAEDHPRPQHTTAHPHFDRHTGEMINMTTIFGRQCFYEIHRGPRDGSSRTLFARVPVDRPSYMHTFGMSENYVILAEYPLVGDFSARTGNERSFLSYHRWEPDRGTRFTVISKASGEVVARVEGEAFFAMHQINCFERGGVVVFDVPAYETDQHVKDFYLDQRRLGGSLATSRVTRWTIPLGGGDARGETVADVFCELPTIDYPRDSGRAGYRVAYATGGDRANPAGFYDRLHRLDMADGGESAVWHEPGTFPGEPVFLPTPGDSDPEQGVVLSLVLDSEREKSMLLVLDAKSFTEVARVVAPIAIPFGFHGEFF